MNLAKIHALLITRNAELRGHLTDALNLLGLAHVAHVPGVEPLNPLPSPAHQPLILCEVQTARDPALDWSSAVRMAEARARYSPTLLMLAVSGPDADSPPGHRTLARRAGFLDALDATPSTAAWAKRLDPWTRHLLAPPAWLAAAQARRGFDVQVLQNMVGNDPLVLHDLLCEFQRSAAIQFGDLVEGHKAGDSLALSTATHKLKSSARTVGAAELAHHCDALETLLESLPPGAALPAPDGLLACWEQLQVDLDPRR